MSRFVHGEGLRERQNMREAARARRENPFMVSRWVSRHERWICVSTYSTEGEARAVAERLTREGDRVKVVKLGGDEQ